MWVQRQRSGQLFRKYVVICFGLVSTVLLSNGLLDLYFSAQDSRATLARLQREKAVAGAGRIAEFLREMERQLAWTVQPAWATDVAEEQPDGDLAPPLLPMYRRLLRQTPAITAASYWDAGGQEQVHVSRLRINQTQSDARFGAELERALATAPSVYYGPVYFRNESEPYMTVALPERGPRGGWTAAEVNLTLVWDLISQLGLGPTGTAYVVDAQGQLVAHSDISLVLQRSELGVLPQVQDALGLGSGPRAAGRRVIEARDFQGRDVLSAYAPVMPPGWWLFIEQPLHEVFAPLYASLLRILILLVGGLALSVLASLVLAQRMVAPIQALQKGAARLGTGALDERIDVRTGDELEVLAADFNRMAAQLQELYFSLEQKVHERTHELAETMNQLQVANQHKSDLLATVSHELRTPLGAIKGYGTALLRFGPRIRAAERREFLVAIDEATDRLTALIDDLLLAQRLEAGRLPLNPERVALPELVEEIALETAQRVREHTLVCEVPPDLPAVRADPRRLHQVLLNLVDNAVKYSPEGGPIRLAAALGGGEVCVCVQDSGEGISAEQLEQIFEPFQQTETSFVRTTRGTGLGLAICRGIIAAHGGRIWAESAGPGRGSSFSFTLPIWMDDDE
jgi:two-component system, NtrC family, sensor kinase